MTTWSLCHSSHFSPAPAVAALLALKAALPGWDERMQRVRLDGWDDSLAGASACSWSFVTCDQVGRVETL